MPILQASSMMSDIMIEGFEKIIRELVYPFCVVADLSSEECNELYNEVNDLVKRNAMTLTITIWWKAMFMKYRKSETFKSLADYLRVNSITM